MSISSGDTIAAVATPPGCGGIGVVRISGPDVQHIGKCLLGALPKPRDAAYRKFMDEHGQVLDEGIAIYFQTPHSFTGEDVLELQGHGGPVVMDLLLKHTLGLGSRLARPGEFSERAFLNHKLDLTQAEAIADLIESHTSQAARSAVRSLVGEFSKRIHELVKGLIKLRTFVEAALDFPEEEIDFLKDKSVLTQLNDLQTKLSDIQNKARQGRLIRDGIRLVIAGRTNVGKSSLLNRFANDDSAIVSDIPGTTRDVLHREINLDGMPVKVVDTAGLRTSDDPIEREGIRRARQEIQQADLIILLIDDTEGFGVQEQSILNELPSTIPVLHVVNKIDLGTKPPGIIKEKAYISAKNSAGINQLLAHIKAMIGYQDYAEGIFSARRRHLVAIEKAARAITLAEQQLCNYGAGELVAEELRIAQQVLNEITGEYTSEDLLGNIFSSFCIGK